MRILRSLLIAIFATLLVWPSANASIFNEFFFEEGIDLRIQSTFEKPVTLESTLYSVTARATTGIPISSDPLMPPYNVRLWVTVGSEADANDQPRSSAFIGFVVPDPNDPVITTDLDTTFRLPTPGRPNPANELQADLTAADLIGDTVYIKLCIEKEFQNVVCAVDTFPIHPDKPRFIESPSLTQVNRSTVYWETLPEDNGQALGHGHRISFTNQNDSADKGQLYIAKRSDSELVNHEGVLRNQIILQSNPAEPGNVGFVPKEGVAYEARLAACGQSDDICGESLVIQNVTAFSDEFTATEGTSTSAVIINWVRHAPGTPQYTLERCEVGGSASCTTLNVGSNATTYDDTSAVPGVNYHYTVFACPSSGSCSNRLVATGITNEGYRAFETPTPATFVSASDGSQLNRIDVVWSEFAPDASGFNNPGYLVEVNNLGSSSDTITVREIDYQQNQPEATFVTGATMGLPSGVLFEFNVRTCADFDSSSPKCADSLSSDIGFARALFASGSPRAGVAKIDWVQFSEDTLRYRLERCTDALNPQCEFIDAGNVTNYEDKDLTVGSRYRYSVYACRTPQNNACVKTGVTSTITIIGNVLPDSYEDDDSPFELNNPNQTVEASVTQSRSFHTAEDQDWTRINFGSNVSELDIYTTSSLETLDTQLALFNATGNIVACALNTPGGFTSNAKLRLPELPAGEYFLRVEQRPGGGLILGPIENYRLNITISTNSSGSAIEYNACNEVDGFPENPNAVNSLITPVLQLLLLE